ncbi:hypothetical protein N9W17_06410 [Jannaschia sp.]|nr:hypothetical protein [Jannaschia sp.]
MLDLICGLFGLIVVLYAITERYDNRPGVVRANLGIFKAELEAGNTIDLNLEVRTGTDVYHSWPLCKDYDLVRWTTCKAGLIEGVSEHENEITGLGVSLRATSSGSLIGSGDVVVHLMTKEHSYSCTLSLATGFRGNIDFANPTNSPNCELE